MGGGGAEHYEGISNEAPSDDQVTFEWGELFNRLKQAKLAQST
jgi:hypothetical protein